MIHLFRLTEGPVEKITVTESSAGGPAVACGPVCNNLKGAGIRRLLLFSPALVAVATGMLLSAPALAGDIIPPKSYALTPGGVNASDGSFVHVVTDLSIGPMKVERFHRTGWKEPDTTILMDHWRDNFDIYVLATPHRYSNGAVEYYKPIVHIGNSASGVYSQTPSSLSSINEWNDDASAGILEWSGSNSWTGGNYVYTDKSGTVYTFTNSVGIAAEPTYSHSQRIARIDFPDGRFQTFTYSGNTLRLVEDSSGYAILYDGSTICGFNRAITYVSSSSTCTGSNLKVTYTEASGSFQVTDVNGQVTAYTMAIAGATCVEPPGYSSCRVTNVYQKLPSDQYVVSQQTLADGAIWQFGHSDTSSAMFNSPDVPPPHDGHHEVYVTDPAGKMTSLTFTKTSPFTMRDANGYSSTFLYNGGTYRFDVSGLPTSEGTYLIEASFPEGNRYLAEYGGPYRNLTKQTIKPKPDSNLPDQVVEFGYGSCVSPGTRQNCGKPKWIRDANGNQTDFTYAGHGGVLSEMKPAPTVGAARPLKLATWVQKYAYIRNSSGSLVAAPAPIWVISTETECQTAAGSNSPVCDSAAQKRITTYQYGANGTANNLLVRGVAVSTQNDSHTTGIVLRTCYTYDNYGNRVSETKPAAERTSCP